MAGRTGSHFERRYPLIDNLGEVDAQGNVHVSHLLELHFLNGYLVAELIKKIVSRDSDKVPPSLITIKSDNSKSTKLTNWNFIWYKFDHQG